MRKLKFKFFNQTIEWLHRKRGSSELTLPASTPSESYRFLKIYGAEASASDAGVGDPEGNTGMYSIPIHAHGKNLMGGEEFMQIHSSLGISKIGAAVVEGCYSTTPLPEYNGTVIIGSRHVKFKKRTQYTLAIHAVYFTSATQRSIAIRLDYSDGTYDAPIIPSSAKELKLCIVSDPTKDLVSISSHTESAANIRYKIDGFGLFEGAFGNYDEIFTPYDGYRCSLSINAPLRKIDFAKDEVDTLTGDVTRRIGTVTISADSTVRKASEKSVFKIPLSPPARRFSRAVSALGEISNENNSGLSIAADGTAILLKHNGSDDISELKAYLSKDPITVLYVLKEPVHEKTDTFVPLKKDDALRLDILTERSPSRVVAEYI